MPMHIIVVYIFQDYEDFGPEVAEPNAEVMKYLSPTAAAVVSSVLLNDSQVSKYSTTPPRPTVHRNPRKVAALNRELFKDVDLETGNKFQSRTVAQGQLQKVKIIIQCQFI